MAGKAAAPGTAVLLVTANVGSLFDDPENLQKNWLREFYQVVHTHKPHFMALHCQEFGGKNYEASMSHVDKFVKELLSSDAMKEYNRARVYLDENYKSQEHFTALGSFYFLHESLKNIYQFDFKAKKYRKVAGKEIYSDTLESTPMLEKEKFPQDYFPECKWSRKGFIRTRWCIADCAFDLVNIHLFHDASNLVAWETSPSVYSGIRHKALGYVLDRIIDQRFEKVSYFVFGDFNFRLDSKSVVETLCTKATMQTVRAADTNEVVKLIFRESDNDRKVMLQLEKKLFDYFNQEVFRDNNGTAGSAPSRCKADCRGHTLGASCTSGRVRWRLRVTVLSTGSMTLTQPISFRDPRVCEGRRWCCGVGRKPPCLRVGRQDLRLRSEVGD
uniref:inositol-polyphosphate 5-phosphatase n=1 Tax=Macaca mulatta TaxID=9544 RepID=F7HTA8_MACMU